MSVISTKKHCPSCFVQIIRDLSRFWTVSGGVIRSPYKSVKLGLWWQHCHCLVRILKTYWHCHHHIHWWTVPVPETVAVYNSVLCPVMTCVHIAETGGETSWSGSDQNTGKGRHLQWPGHTPSSLPGTPDTNIWLTDSGWSDKAS